MKIKIIQWTALSHLYNSEWNGVMKESEAQEILKGKTSMWHNFIEPYN